MQQSSADLTALRNSQASGKVQPGSTTVHLTLEDGTDYPFTGTVEFSEVSVDVNSGTVTLRARFPNPIWRWLPGTFVTALFEQAVQPNAFLVPQPAVLRDFDGSAYVYVVGTGNKSARRKIPADHSNGTNWVVTSGLKSGDRVLTQGLANMKQGMPIKPVPASAPQRVGVPKGFKPGGSGGGGRGGPRG